ncbi:hypothetical protein JYU34_007256 [Plutella xylostella]|uniref:Ionotropic receptor n=1 Tax=Plutella xylostella TaxID=51655 RepID=A0ABQ7QPX7_PLUXY|nr:hypothetical protein JYU34_007256 [Plutella xylostella]
MLNVAEKENYTLEYKYVGFDERYGIVLPNGTATGILKYTQQGISDVSSGGFMLIQNRAELFDYVWGYHYATYNVFTRANIEQKWKFIYKEFGFETWLLIVGAFIAIIALSFFIIYLSYQIRLRIYEPFFLVVILWGYMFSNTSSLLNSRKLYRGVLVCWIWFTFFICCFYSTALYSLITANKWPEISKDLNYFVENKYEPCISNTTREFFVFAYNESLPPGRDRQECEVTEDCFNTVVAEPNTYALEAGYAYQLRECDYLDEEGNEKMEDWYFFGNIITVLFFHKGSPFVKVFEKYTRHMYEAGLFTRQEKEIRFENSLLCHNKVKVFHKFNLKDLRIPFSVISIGWVCSAIVFVFEYLSKPNIYLANQ